MFNYFAQPPAQRNFCARANEIAQIVSTTPTDQLVEQAPAHLARLDEPFKEFYEAYAQYQADVIAWDAKYAPPPAIMTAPDRHHAGGAGDDARGFGRESLTEFRAA